MKIVKQPTERNYIENTRRTAHHKNHFWFKANFHHAELYLGTHTMHNDCEGEENKQKSQKSSNLMTSRRNAVRRFGPSCGGKKSELNVCGNKRRNCEMELRQVNNLSLKFARSSISFLLIRP